MSAVCCAITAALAALPEANSFVVDNICSAKARTSFAAGWVFEGTIGTSTHVVSARDPVRNRVGKTTKAILHTNMTFVAAEGVLGSQAATWCK